MRPMCSQLFPLCLQVLHNAIRKAPWPQLSHQNLSSHRPRTISPLKELKSTMWYHSKVPYLRASPFPYHQCSTIADLTRLRCDRIEERTCTGPARYVPLAGWSTHQRQYKHTSLRSQKGIVSNLYVVKAFGSHLPAAKAAAREMCSTWLVWRSHFQPSPIWFLSRSIRTSCSKNSASQAKWS